MKKKTSEVNVAPKPSTPEPEVESDEEILYKFCPCNGKCHDTMFPCSMSCMIHHKNRKSLSERMNISCQSEKKRKGQKKTVKKKEA